MRPTTEAVRSVGPGAPGTATSFPSHELTFNTTVTTVCSSLQELCKELHQKIDVVDEARYDIGIKVEKNENEVCKTL